MKYWVLIEKFSKCHINIINLSHEDLQHPTRKNHALPPSLQVFVALRFSLHWMTAEQSLKALVSATAGRTVQRVTKALCEHQNRFIKFPRAPDGRLILNAELIFCAMHVGSDHISDISTSIYGD